MTIALARQVTVGNSVTIGNQEPLPPAPAVMPTMPPLPPGLIDSRPAAELDPVDLWGNFAPPKLPERLLPPMVENFAFVLAEQMGADPAGLAMAALTVCAAAIPDSIKVQVKTHDQTWLESARLWTALIGLPSTKKSPIMNAAVAPLARIDASKVRQWQGDWARWNAQPKDERGPEPLQKRMRIEDTTVEAMQEVLRGSTEGVLCVRDELSGWFASMEKYSGGSKGGSADRAVWLQAFNGGQYAVNRIGRGVSLIDNLSVSLLGGIQPDAIRKVAADATDDGLLQRIFPIVLKPATVGTDAPAPPAQAIYDFTVAQLPHLKPPPEGGLLRFDERGQAVRRKLEERHNQLQAVELTNRKLAAHIGKLDGLFARLCIVWHCLCYINKPHLLPETIDEETAEDVADFMKWFLLPHAAAFYNSVLGIGDDHDRLQAIAAYIIAHKLPRITVRDVQRGDRAMRRIAKADVLPVLEQLTALNWLSPVEGPRASSDPQFMVNKRVHELYADRAEREQMRRNAAKLAIDEIYRP